MLSFSSLGLKEFAFLAKLLITVLLLIYFANTIDSSQISATFQNVRFEFLIASVLQLLFIPILGSARWRIALQSLGYTVALPRLVSLFWIGMSLNQVLPGAVGGDAVRGWMVYKNGIRAIDAALSVLIERVMLLVLLLLIVAVSSLATDLVPPALALAGVVCGVGGIIFTVLLPRFNKILSSFPDVFIVRLLLQTSHGISKIMSERGSFILFILLCTLTHLNLVLASYWLGLAFGLPLSFSTYLFITPLMALASVLPISIGGWGVREVTAVSLLGSLIGQDMSIIYSIGFGCILLFASIPGFFLLLWHWFEKDLPSSA